MHAAPPAVDEGEPPRTLRASWHELAPTPGRFGNTVRLVAVVSILVTLCELFRVPEPAVAGFIAVFISKEDAASTVQGAVVIGVFALLGIGLAVLCFMLTLSNPALRILLVAALSLTTMFLSRASTLGPAFFLTGFLATFGLTYGDQLQEIGLQPSSAADTPEGSLPELVFMPPEEALLHTLLWLGLVAAMSVAVVAIVNLFAGQDPAVLLQRGLGARLDALAAACNGTPGADQRLRAMALEGTAAMSKQAELSAKFRRVTPRRRADAALVEPVGRLVVGVLAWTRVCADEAGTGNVAAQLRAGGDEALAPLAPILKQWSQAVLGGCDTVVETPPAKSPDAALAAVSRTGAVRVLWDGDAAVEVVRGAASSATLDAALAPLAVELAETFIRAREALRPRNEEAVTQADKKKKKPFALMKPDAFTNPDYPRFGLKATMAALICYLAYAGADWSQIHTALVTCFFVPQETLGQTLHKAILRICGCLVGATLGIGTILLFMPAMTDIGQLLLPIGVVTFVGGWIANGSARTSYAGLQLAFAFYLVILQGFGPTLDMQTGRDRAIGILFGIIVASTVFAAIWPVRMATLVRGQLAGALEQLAEQVERVGKPPALRPFFQAVAGVRDLMVHDALERQVKRSGDSGEIDARMLTELQALVVPVTIVLQLADKGGSQGGLGMLPASVCAEIEAYHQALARWLRSAATWVREQAPASRFADTLPAPPVLLTDRPGASQAAWYARLDGDLRRIIERLVPVKGERQVAELEDAGGR